MIEILFYLPLLLWALDRFGLVGAAAAWTARVGLDLALLLIAVNRYVLPVGAPAPVRPCGGRPCGAPSARPPGWP